MAFAPQKLLKLIEPKILEAFLMGFNIKLTKELEKNSERLYEVIQESNQFTQIESQLREIKEMSGQASIERMIQFAQDSDIEIDDGFYQCDNNEGKAMWAFLHDKELFENTFLWNHLSNWGSEYRVANHSNLEKKFFSGEKLKKLENLLKVHFKKEKKAYYCQVSMSVNPSTDTICISAHFDDYSKAELGVKEGAISKVHRKPIKDLHFLIFPDKGKIALQFKRAQFKRKSKLTKLFVEGVLGEVFDEESMYTLNLQPLLKSSFRLDVPSEDMLEFYRIKSLRLDSKAGTKQKRITLDVKKSDKRDDIYELIHSLRINKELYSVSQAIIHFQFKDMGKRGSVTVSLTNPNNDNFNDTEIHKKCKQYLIKAGIIT